MRTYNPLTKKVDIIVSGHITINHKGAAIWAVVADQGPLTKVIAFFIDQYEADNFAYLIGGRVRNLIVPQL